jgi:23S rRNA (cytosine1962-C5)-methyltransferase
VTHLDTSQASLDLAVEHTRLNKVTCDVEYVQADVFEELRRYRDAERTFDVIILDPPKFAHSQKQVESAARGYKDINMLAFDLLEPGGLLMTFSCSGQVDTDLFQKIVFSASADSGVQARKGAI